MVSYRHPTKNETMQMTWSVTDTQQRGKLCNWHGRLQTPNKERNCVIAMLGHKHPTKRETMELTWSVTDTKQREKLCNWHGRLKTPNKERNFVTNTRQRENYGTDMVGYRHPTKNETMQMTWSVTDTQQRETLCYWHGRLQTPNKEGNYVTYMGAYRHPTKRETM